MYEQPAAGSSNKLGILLIIVLGLGALGFGVLAITQYNKAHTATTTLNAAKLQAAEAARDAQKKTDAADAELANESPFRSYIAPQQYGSFEIKFPKNWSGSVDEELNSQTQVTLVLNPDFVKRQNAKNDLVAAQVIFVQQTLNEYMTKYKDVKTITRSNVTVSNIAAVQLKGTFPDKRTVRLVAVPVRDKTMVFTNEDSKYDSQFDQILAQAKINP